MRQAQFRLTRMKKISMMNRYSAVALRCQMEFGPSKLGLEVQIEQLEEQIRAMLPDRGRQGGRGGAPGAAAVVSGLLITLMRTR